MGVTRVQFDSDEHVTIYAVGFSGTEKSMGALVPSAEKFMQDVARWQEERLNIQDCFPYLDKDVREFMLSGTTPEEWDEMFPKEERSN
jgi:hypothetical protein